MSERRILGRLDLAYYLRVLDGSTDRQLGHAANISTGGILLISEEPIERNRCFQLKMLLPTEFGGKRYIEFEASSRWCGRNGNGDFFRTGFELSNVRRSDLEIIRAICLNPVPYGKENFDIRRLFDVTASFFGLLLVSPILLLIGLAIRHKSSSPILYSAKRVGKFGREFLMYKFRTMTEPPGANGPKVTAHDDPRITRIGRFLRQTKLNELPQLFNVLKGEMSFVGPRPEDPEFVAHYTPEQREVLSVRPGITSLATILYAGEEKLLSFSDVTKTYVRSILPDKLRLDLLYIRNQSLLLDFDILVQTMLVLIPRFRNAAPQVEDILMGPVRIARRYLSWFAIDAAIALLSVSLAGVLWRLASPIDVGVGRSLIAALLITALFSLTNWITGVQRIYWRYANPSEAIGVVGSAIGATILLLITNSLVQPPRFPPQMLIMAGIFALSGFLASRYHRSLLQGLASRIENLRPAATAGRERVLVVGAGDAAQLTILLLLNNSAGRPFHVVGIVDDDLNLLGSLLHRVPVLGVCDQISEIVREKNVGTIVFAIHSIDDSRRQYLIRRCQETSARTVIVPNLLGNLRHEPHRKDDERVAPRQGKSASQGAMSFGRTSSDLSQQIHALAEQARNGDIARVAKGLGRLDKMLRESQSEVPTRHREGSQPNLKSGDQIHS